MSKIALETLRAMLPPGESKGMYIRPSHVAFAYEDILSIISAWEADLAHIRELESGLADTGKPMGWAIQPW